MMVCLTKEARIESRPSYWLWTKRHFFVRVPFYFYYYYYCCFGYVSVCRLLFVNVYIHNMKYSWIGWKAIQLSTSCGNGWRFCCLSILVCWVFLLLFIFSLSFVYLWLKHKTKQKYVYIYIDIDIYICARVFGCLATAAAVVSIHKDLPQQRSTTSTDGDGHYF